MSRHPRFDELGHGAAVQAGLNLFGAILIYIAVRLGRR